MRLSSALLFLTLGTTSSVGNAFANPNGTGRKVRFTEEIQHFQGRAFVPSSTIRGGGCSSLSATAVDETLTVREYISEENWALLSSRGKAALSKLICSDVGINGQKHVYDEWPEAGTDDEGKIQLAEQVSLFLL